MRLPKWIWRTIRSKRVRTVALCSPFILAILGAGYYGLENFTGRRAVEKCLAELEARGVETSLAKAVDRGVPDEDNVWKHPLMLAGRELDELGRLYGDKFSFPLAVISRRSGTVTSPGIVGHLPRARRDFAEPTPFVEWFEPPLGIPEEAVARKLLDDLAALATRAEALEEAFERPAFQVDLAEVEFEPGKAPPFTLRTLRFRRFLDFYLELASLRLAVGEVDVAHREVRLVLDASRRLMNEPASSVSMLIGGIGLSEGVGVIHEGVLRGSWSERQLESLLETLSAFDLDEACRESLRLEVSYQATSLRYELEGERRARQPVEWRTGWKPDAEVIRERLGEIWRKIRPVGAEWKEQAEAIRRIAAASESLGNMDEEAKPVPSASTSEFLYVATSIIDSIVHRGRARFGTELALSRTGLALELHRRSRGSYPETLEELVPEHLEAVPDDPWARGRPIRYERMPGGGARVWSVGEDGVDEGGRPHIRREVGDEVWLTRPIPGFTESDWKR